MRAMVVCIDLQFLQSPQLLLGVHASKNSYTNILAKGIDKRRRVPRMVLMCNKGGSIATAKIPIFILPSAALILPRRNVIA